MESSDIIQTQISSKHFLQNQPTHLSLTNRSAFGIQVLLDRNPGADQMLEWSSSPGMLMSETLGARQYN